MTTILLPIKPCFVKEIWLNKKLYEYRKTIPKRKDIKKIIIYETSPKKKIVGEAEIETILVDTPENIWNKTKDYSGISEKEFMKYYKNKNIAIAYKLNKIKQYDQPKKLQEIGVNYIPQSLIYLD